MYHGRFKKSHYEAGFNWGRLLYNNGKIISNNHTFKITEERRTFAKKCLPIYEQYYPEVLEEIKGLAEGQNSSYEDFYTFLLSMYCFEFNNHCTCLAISDKNNIIFGRNSDFLVSLEKLYMNCLYNLDNAYSFNGNTTAFIEIEDGINEYGLAVGLTFIYPTIIKAGFNAGMLVRYILEKCQTTNEAITFLKNVPIASQQTLTIADSKGNIAVVECNCNNVEVIKPNKDERFISIANEFNSEKMKQYNNYHVDNWRANERYLVAATTLKKYQNKLSFNLIQDILSGKYGFMCQYDRKTDADTVWSVIYDIGNKEIYRVEGNPQRKQLKKDNRLKFKY